MQKHFKLTDDISMKKQRVENATKQFYVSVINCVGVMKGHPKTRTQLEAILKRGDKMIRRSEDKKRAQVKATMRSSNVKVQTLFHFL